MSAGRVPGRVRLARALRAAGPSGIHTLSCREQLRLGNPSERVEDLRRRGFVISAEVETRHGCHGARYVMVRDAGDSRAWLTDAQLDAEVGGGTAPATVGSRTPARSGLEAAADLSAEPMWCWFGDFTPEGYDPEQPFRLLPVSEVVGVAA